MDDLRTWSIRNVPAELMNEVRSTAYINQMTIADIVTEACQFWLDRIEEDYGEE